MKYTKKDIKGIGICSDYTDERLDELAAGRESLSERELAELDIPIDDRIYLLGKLCADEHNTVARRIAMDVLPLWNRPVPEVVKRYIETGESDIKDAAWAAAWDAWDAWDAAGAAARDAAMDAAWDAAWDAGSAARYAARDAARYAARDAAMDAARDAARAAAWAAVGSAAMDAAGSAARYAAGSAARYAAMAAARYDARAAAMLKSKKKYLDWMVEFCENREAVL
jgi:hypothetical protein